MHSIKHERARSRGAVPQEERGIPFPGFINFFLVCLRDTKALGALIKASPPRPSSSPLSALPSFLPSPPLAAFVKGGFQGHMFRRQARVRVPHVRLLSSVCPWHT